MSEVASQILDMPSRQVLESRIRFRAIGTKRVRVGKILSISGSGVKVLTLDSKLKLVAWDGIISIEGGEG